MSHHTDIPHFVADSTLANALDQMLNADRKVGPRWDMAVRMEGPRSAEARIIAQFGTSFCMSGAVIQHRHMKD